jgi:YD repeat-containing protein
VLSNTRTIGTQSFATAYHYDSAGRLNEVTYPTDTLLSYSLDALGRVQRSEIQESATWLCLPPVFRCASFGLRVAPLMIRAPCLGQKLLKYCHEG